MDRAKKRPDHDDIFDNLKTVVVDEAMRRHSWEDKVSLVKRTVFWDIMLCSLVDTNFSEAPHSSKMRVNIYHTIQHHMSEDSNFF
jgi:hypothetical protein